MENSVVRLPQCLNAPNDGLPWAPPLDVEDIVVRMETAGITDDVARADYGFPDRWALADNCFRILNAEPVVPNPAPNRQPLWPEYLRGFGFALPLMLCTAAMIVFQYSLWGGDVSAEMAAAIGLGTVTSFIATGGIIQAMARRSLFLLSVEQKEGGASCAWAWVRLGIVVLLLSAILLTAASTYFEWLPPDLTWVFAAYHLSLGILWLAVGLLHMLERSAAIVSATAIGIVAVVGLHSGGRIALAEAQIAGILLTGACAFSTAARTLRANKQPAPTSLVQDLAFVWPHFLFGLLYYAFLFADRLLAWTRPELAAASTVVFRGNYETALDIALVSFVLQVGWIRYAIVSLFRALLEAQRHYSAADGTGFRTAIQKQYVSTSFQLLPIAAGVSAAVFAGAQWYPRIHASGILFTLGCALLATPFLVLGLWNTNLQFRLGRSRLPALLVAVGLAVDLSGGYLFSRLGAYEYAVCGFALGAMVFGISATIATLRMLRTADYLEFASAL